MKKIMQCLALTAALFCSTVAFGQTDDHAAIVKSLNYYLDGGTNSDYSTLKKAFHTEATMQYITAEGEYKNVNALQFFSKMKPGPKSNRKTRITRVDVNGTAASARIEIDYDDFRFVDFMNLLKVNGQWLIVSKIFYRETN